MNGDADRILQLERDFGILRSDVNVIQANLIPLREGVSNFREFQRRGTRYFDRAEAVLDYQERKRVEDIEKENRERARKKMWLMILGPLIVALIGFLSYQWYSFTEDLIQIDHEWRQAHHGSTPNVGFLLPHIAPQDAINPPH